MKKPEFKMPAVLGKLSTKFKPKPVFNQPVRTERRYHIARALYAFFLVLLVMIAASTIGLKAMTINFIEDNRDTGFEFQTEDPQPTLMAALPRQLYTGPAKLALVAGVISVFVGIGHAAFVFLDWHHGHKVCIPGNPRPVKQLTSIHRRRRTPSAATLCSCTSATAS